MKSTRSLYNCMNELNQALQAINGLNSQLGKVSAKKTVSLHEKDGERFRQFQQRSEKDLQFPEWPE